MPVSSRWTAVLRRPVGVCAAVALVLLVGLAVLGPVVFSGAATTNDIAAALQGPSRAHLLGTDALGRDVLARVLVATRLSVELALGAMAIGTVLGVALGSLPAVLGRRLGRFVVAVINVSVAFPGLLLALFLAVVFGLGAKGGLLAIGIALVPGIARLTHTLASSVASADYVAASRLLGVSRSRQVARHILPNIAEPLVINVTVGVGGALLAFAGLSFLGLGVQPPSYDWGQLLGEGLSRIFVNPTAALAPGVAVVLAGLTFNLVGDAVARVVGTAAPRSGGATRTADLTQEGARPASDTGVLMPPAPRLGDPVLRVEGLTVRFPGADGGWITPVADVSLTLGAGEMVGIVGESGSGKSLTALAAAQLVTEPGVVEARCVQVAGRDLDAMGAAERDTLLGTSMAMVFQDPATTLNPAMRVGRQLAEVTEVHQGASRSAALARALDRLRAVRIPAAARRARQYPHELSGGMRQRAVIGMGLMASPRVVIADEPTTALDVTVQRHILDLLDAVRREQGAGIMLISHDVAVISQVCHRVLVMYAGRVVEELPVGVLTSDAAHPYTVALVATVPDMATDRDRPLATIAGRPPDPSALPPGCPYAPRCRYATDRCREQRPPLVDFADGRRVACWHPRTAVDQPDRPLTAQRGAS